VHDFQSGAAPCSIVSESTKLLDAFGSCAILLLYVSLYGSRDLLELCESGRVVRLVDWHSSAHGTSGFVAGLFEIQRVHNAVVVNYEVARRGDLVVIRETRVVLHAEELGNVGHVQTGALPEHTRDMVR
jgi:hypothetical protein